MKTITAFLWKNATWLHLSSRNFRINKKRMMFPENYRIFFTSKENVNIAQGTVKNTNSEDAS